MDHAMGHAGRGTRLWIARAATTLLTTALLLVGWSARAAPPPNDTFDTATVVSVGDTDTVDTTEATADADGADGELIHQCFSFPTDASVWYELTPDTDGTVFISALQSNYEAVIVVGTGTPGSLQAQSCGTGVLQFFATAGTTYHVVVADSQRDGGGNGGELVISFETTPPPLPTITLTVDPIGEADGHTGLATLSGTYSCTSATFIDISVNLFQSVGRKSTVQSFTTFINDVATCDGATHPWSATMLAANGKFGNGSAIVAANAFACGFGCTSEQLGPELIQLRGGGK